MRVPRGRGGRPPAGSDAAVPLLAVTATDLGDLTRATQQARALSREVDHVMLATGYRVDVRRYRFLSPGLLAGLRTADGYPLLDVGLQSSVPGLYFLGAPAAASFGPVVRFVSGTEFASDALARHVTGARRADVRAEEADRFTGRPAAERRSV